VVDEEAEAEESNAEEDDEGVVTDRTDSDEDEESDEEDEDEDGQEQEGDEQEGEEREVDDAMLGDADEEIGDLQEAVVRGGDDEEDEDEQVSNPTSHSFTNLFHSRLLQAPPPALYHPLAPGFSLLPPTSLPLPPSPLLPRSLHKHLFPVQATHHTHQRSTEGGSRHRRCREREG
jgi:hypothetical protein